MKEARTSLGRSLRILEAVVQSSAPRGISELARELGLDKSAVQRAFLGLTQAGYLEKVPGGTRYRPTLRIWELGTHVIAQHEACRLVHPMLRYGAKLTGLTAYFAWEVAPEVIYLDKVEGEQGRMNSSLPGRRVAMYKTAAGQAVLAFLAADRREAWIRTWIEETAGTAAALQAEVLRANLEETRRRLYAQSCSGTFAQVNGVAAPIWAQGAEPIGSLVLVGEAQILPETDFPKVGNIAVSLAEQATRALGGSYPGFLSDMH